MVKSELMPQSVVTEPHTELAERGWRTEIKQQPDGTIIYSKVPLTSAEFLHPQEGYHLPTSKFHNNISRDAEDVLNRRYANNPTVEVFRDMLIKWDISELGDHSPDLFVVFGIQNKEQNRSSFVVAEEGVRPALIIEVVSPRYRKEDREIKVIDYEQAKVQEYVIIDRRNQRGQLIDEVLGYRLINERYRPVSPDDDGRILCETVGLWLSLQDGCLVMEDNQTGERLRTARELAAENEDLKARLQELQAQIEGQGSTEGK
jgi:Uma2 family endonuclease